MSAMLDFVDLLMMTKLLLYVFCIGAVFAAEGVDHRGVAVEVLHFSRLGRTSYASFRNQQVVTQQAPFPGQSNNLCGGLREQILAGYRLFPDIDVEDITTHKNFFLAGVREHISEPQSFLSSDLEWWFARIGEILDARVSLTANDVGHWRKMDY